MIYFTGDICLCDKAFDIGIGIGSKISKGEIKPFSKLKKQEGDLWVGNFEGVVSDTTNRSDYTRDSFRIGSEVFDKAKSIIDYWGIANNHVMEHGEAAYNQMEEILTKRSRGVFGSSNQHSIVAEHQGKRVAITGLCLRSEESNDQPLYWHLPELSEIAQEYEKIKYVDFKVMYIHWGVEYVDHPYVEQVRLAHWLIDLGYDLVVGMHPHVLQGYEVYKGKYIFYSLGNCMFNMPYKPSTYSALVTLDAQTGKVGTQYVWVDDQCCPKIVSEGEVPQAYRFETLNVRIGDEKNIEKYVSEFHRGLKAYRKSNNRNIVRNVLKFRPTVFLKIIASYIKRRLHHAH